MAFYFVLSFVSINFAVMKHSKEEKLKAFERLLDIQERLRKECPWDRKQTFESLRPNTIEEVYELADAIMHDDHKEICKELGDVMEHVVLYSIMGEETGDFDIADVCNHQSDKLMFRHDFIDWGNSNTSGSDPKWYVTDSNLTINSKGQVVYKDEVDENNDPIPTTDTEVESSWEKRKQKERDGNKTVLSGVPSSLPSIIKAYRIQDKARNVGFDWENRDDVWAKVREELGELETELKKDDKENSTKELGDFIFSVVNAARLYHLNPDNALEETNKKFIYRFTYIEQEAERQGKSISDLTLAQMDELWDKAKELEKENGSSK